MNMISYYLECIIILFETVLQDDLPSTGPGGKVGLIVVLSSTRSVVVRIGSFVVPVAGSGLPVGSVGPVGPVVGFVGSGVGIDSHATLATALTIEVRSVKWYTWNTCSSWLSAIVRSSCLLTSSVIPKLYSVNSL